MLLLNNKYQFDPKTDLLGEGGFSRVYKANDILLNRTVALKIANRSDFQSSYNYLEEIRKAIDFNHINVARYYDGFEYNEISFGEKVTYQVGVMEYLPEGILTHEVFRKLIVPEKKKLVKGILEGLKYLHEEKNIIHRDIKPSNILLARIKGELVPKIADFGISKERGDKSTGISRIVGSFDYMAPEQFDKKKHIDFNTDLWAFGVLLYNLCLGRMPFSDESITSEAEVIRNIVDKPVPEDIKRIPSPFREIISLCLVKERHNRIGSASDLLSFLEENESVAVQPPPPHFNGRTKVLEEPENEEKTIIPLQKNEKKSRSSDYKYWSRRLISRTGLFVSLGILLTTAAVVVIFGVINKQKASRNEREKLISGLLSKADGCMDKNLFRNTGTENAFIYLQEIVKMDPENQEAKSRMEKIAKKLAEDGDSAFQMKKFGEAAVDYADALLYLPNDSNLIRRQKKAVEESQIPQKTSPLQEKDASALQLKHFGDSLFRLKNYRGAVAFYNQALVLKPGDASLAARIRDAESLQNAGSASLVIAPGNDYFQKYNMVQVQGGTFEMGNGGGEGDEDEKPVHTVKVDGFYMGKYEITVGQFKEFIEATGYRTSAEKDGWGYFLTNEGFERKPGMNWRYNASGNVHPESSYLHPAIFVSWNDASEFCKWLSQKTGLKFRLPTEAEWEFASRGGRFKNQYRFSGSDNLNLVGWYNENSGHGTHSVGEKSGNSLGLFDLSGNVWEWCMDIYGPYGSEAQSNPSGATSGNSRVLRGGGWFDPGFGCRITNRGSYAPGYKDFNTGFRLVISK